MENKEDMKNTYPAAGLRFSRFGSVRSKCATDTTLARFIDEIRGADHRPQVEEYRRLQLLPGHEAQAQTLKNGMPCVTPSAICLGGHAQTDLRELSGILCIDFDHTDDDTDALKQRLRALPYVLLAFTSISGRGVKVFVRIRPSDAAKGYAPLYAAVGRAVSAVAGHPYDEKCAPLTQPCFYSWDPQAWFNLEAVPFDYQPAAQPPAPPSAAPAARQPEGFMSHFISNFERHNPFVRGQRNDRALKLGRAAARKGFSSEEVEKLCRLFAEQYASSDFTENDIRKRVTAGYQYANSHPTDKEPESRKGSGFRGHYRPLDSFAGADEADEVLEKNDELRASAPYIPAEVYDHLPELLRRCTASAANARERDILLLGSLNCCSALLPRVRFFYRDRYYSPHFYLAVVAPAGTGKGGLACTAALLNRTADYYEQQNRERKRQFEDDKTAWEMELRQAAKEQRRPDTGLRPEQPVPVWFKLPATTSKSRLIESLAAAADTGCILLSTEIATLTTAFQMDYGNFEDIFLKAYNHEEVASSYKIDGEPRIARRPRLAVCLSGTQEQFRALFRSLESGLFSRFMFYTRQQELAFESCAPGGGNLDREQLFGRAGDELFAMHQNLMQHPTLVSFSPAQWQEHTRLFNRLLASLRVSEGEAATGILLRCALQAMRVAAVLTTFRKYADFPEAGEYLCTDSDFRCALLIARTVLHHSLLLGSSLPDSSMQPVLMQTPDKFAHVLSKLPDRFSYTDFVAEAESADVSESTAKRWLRKALKSLFIDKQENTYIKLSDPDGAKAVEGSIVTPVTPDP